MAWPGFVIAIEDLRRRQWEWIEEFDRLTDAGWKYDLLREEFWRPYFDDAESWGEVSRLIGKRWAMYRTSDMDVHLVPPNRN